MLIPLLSGCYPWIGKQEHDANNPRCDDPIAWFPDADGDGFGDPDQSLTDCVQPQGYIQDNSDCDDRLDTVGPNWYFRDQDQDTYGDANHAGTNCAPAASTDVQNDDDCDDLDITIRPGVADHASNGVDDNCDGVPGVDYDGDGHASMATGGDDCDPNDDAIYPGAPDFVANDVDNNCDDVPGVDTDGDGDADLASGGDDCDDLNATIHSDAQDICNSVDDDCDGVVDNVEQADIPWYSDVDGDGFGDTSSPTFSCTQPNGLIADGSDCNDARDDIHPNADEVWYDGLDQDCDGGSDYDQDGDGSDRLASGGLDCDDVNAAMAPGAPSACDGFDNNCDGTVSYDEGGDIDNDGFVGCVDDCDDGNPAVFPGAPEYCDGYTNDCMGVFFELPVPGGFPTIQSAINAAQTGDVICVAAGVYPESLDFNSVELTLQGVAGAAATVIQGQGSSTITMDGGWLRGLTIRDGQANDGGGVYVASGVAVVDNVVVRNNVATHNGGGIYVAFDAELNATNLQVFDNDATWSGGGLFIEGGGQIFASAILSNTSGYTGAGIAAEAGGLGIPATGGDLLLDDTLVQGNVTADGAGGISVYEGSLDVLNSQILDNVGSEGAGIQSIFGVHANVIDTEIAGNLASGWGGGLASYETADVSLLRTRLCENSSPTGAAAGLLLELSNTTVTNSVVCDNVGDGIYAAEGESLSVENTTIVGNAGAGVHVFDIENTFTNTAFIDNEDVGLTATASMAVYEPTFSACNLWNNTGGPTSGVPSPVSTNGNIQVDPGFVSYSPAMASHSWDLHLSPSSAMGNVGEAGLNNPDATRSDIGAYGGPQAAFTYYDDGDGDGLYDGWEASFGLNSGSNDAAVDGDGDGLSNLQEFELGTWPMVSDTDGDGVNDGAEANGATDPLDSGDF